jgi:hypothetical protein
MLAEWSDSQSRSIFWRQVVEGNESYGIPNIFIASFTMIHLCSLLTVFGLVSFAPRGTWNTNARRRRDVDASP